MTEAADRPLTRGERAAAYAGLGLAIGVVFTALQAVADSRARDPRLRGHSYLWMLPVYAQLAWLYEPLHDRMRGRAVWQRATAYASGFMVCELAAGSAIRRMVGVVPWDYRGHSRLAIAGGAVRLDYAPLWAVAGLVMERVDNGMRRLRVRELD